MKKSLKSAFVVVFAAVAGYGVYTSQKSDAISDLMLVNADALANGESGGSGKIYCCGNYGVCMRVIDSSGKIREVAGVESSVPCV